MKEFMNENFTEDLNEMIYLLVTLFKTKLPIEPFIQNAGLNALALSLKNFYDQKKFVLNCFNMLREICFSSPENKDRLTDISINFSDFNLSMIYKSFDLVKLNAERSKKKFKILQINKNLRIKKLDLKGKLYYTI